MMLTKVLCCCSFLIDALYQLKDISFILSWLNVFIMKRCWIFSSVFPVSIEIIMWSLSLVLLVWCSVLIDFEC